MLITGSLCGLNATQVSSFRVYNRKVLQNTHRIQNSKNYRTSLSFKPTCTQLYQVYGHQNDSLMGRTLPPHQNKQQSAELRGSVGRVGVYGKRSHHNNLRVVHPRIHAGGKPALNTRTQSTYMPA